MGVKGPFPCPFQMTCKEKVIIIFETLVWFNRFQEKKKKNTS